MTGSPARDVLTIFLGGSEEVPGLIFYGLVGDDHAVDVPTFGSTRWPDSPAPEPLVLHGQGWRVVGWELHLPMWPRAEDFRGAIRGTLQELINAGCRVAWVGAEGIPYADPPDLFDPQWMTGGVLAWLTSDRRFGCPLDPDQPLAGASDEELLRLRAFAGRLATGE